jgi:hypothetical protein
LVFIDSLWKPCETCQPITRDIVIGFFHQSGLPVVDILAMERIQDGKWKPIHA